MVSALAPQLVTQPEPRLAVLIPCYNEASTVAKVVADFRAALPNAAVYVYDNNSKDETSARAREAGATAADASSANGPSFMAVPIRAQAFRKSLRELSSMYRLPSCL